jgi:hypothetical protein
VCPSRGTEVALILGAYRGYVLICATRAPLMTAVVAVLSVQSAIFETKDNRSDGTP